MLEFSPQFVSLIGFGVTIAVVVFQFREARNEKVSEQQRTLYIECFSVLEEIIENPSLAFTFEYWERVSGFRSKMKLIASNDVLNSYQDFAEYLSEINNGYIEFCNENDPFMDYQKIEEHWNPDFLEFEETCHISDSDCDKYALALERYLSMNQPAIAEIRRHLDRVLDLMRKDFGSDKYKGRP